MLEIARQGCLMYPVNTYNETIKRTMDVFKSWLMDLSKSDIFGDRLHQYWRAFIGNVLQVFTVKSQGSEETTAHIAICKQSVAILSYFSQELAKKLDNETWTHLQLTILSSTFEFVNRIDKATQSEQGIASAADFLFQALFFIWIKSEVTTKEMWGEFQQKISSLVHWKSTVSNWKEKLIQLTFILKDFIFASSDIELLTGPKKVGRATTSVPRDAKLDAINWNEDRITEIWFIMLDILGNINKISDPNNYEIAMSCMREAIELLLQAEQDSLQYDEQPPIPLYGVFLPVLLEGCSNDPRLLKGILIAYNTMVFIYLFFFFSLKLIAF